MKWTLFSDKLPPNIEEAHMRYAEGHEKLVYDYYHWMKGNGVKCEVKYDITTLSTPTPKDTEYIHFGQWECGGRHDFNEIEWLEEDDLPIEESRCCEQNDKLRAEIYRLSGLDEDKPLGDHFDEIEKLIQKQHIIGIMRADVKDGLYCDHTPNCICGQKMTLVRPGKYQCDHCGN